MISMHGLATTTERSAELPILVFHRCMSIQRWSWICPNLGNKELFGVLHIILAEYRKGGTGIAHVGETDECVTCFGGNLVVDYHLFKYRKDTLARMCEHIHFIDDRAVLVVVAIVLSPLGPITPSLESSSNHTPCVMAYCSAARCSGSIIPCGDGGSSCPSRSAVPV